MMRLETLLAKATPAQRDYVRFLRSGSPEAQAHTAKAVHGFDPESYQCPACGTAYQYPHSVCQGCRRVHQRVCATSGCGAVIEPMDGCDVPPYCAGCTASQGRRGRAESFARFGLGPRERMTAQTWTGPEPHQVAAVQALEGWLSSAVWRGDPFASGVAAYYLGGKAGRGKTVIAAWFVHRAYVQLGLVNSFRWHTQAQLALLFAERHGPNGDLGLATWKAVQDAPLLVIDDLFADRITPAFGEALATLLRERLDRVLPTLVTSNQPPNWQSYFDTDIGRLQSRWAGYGRELTLGGPDMRARRAA